MKAYDILKHSHSGLAYLVLISLLFATIYYFTLAASKKNLNIKSKTTALITMIIVHLQFVFGIGLYFISPIVKQALGNISGAMKSENLRLYAVEHPMVMLIVVVLVTIAHRRVKNAAIHERKLGYSAGVLFIISLILALSRIPWSVWPVNN